MDRDEDDAQLLAAARAGQRDAFELLWSRHEAAVHRYARQLARPSDVDELVSESFYRVLRAIASGGGPETGFRSYLLTTLRRTHIDTGRSYHQRISLTGDDRDLDVERVPSAAEVASERAEHGAAWRAWASLPEDAKTLLWQLIVEEQTPAQLAPSMGTTPNGVSSRAVRARERLRQAYLQQHLSTPPDERCLATRTRLGEYTRRSVSIRDKAKIDQHLLGCLDCQAALAELAELNSTFRASAVPLVLGAVLLARRCVLAINSTPVAVRQAARVHLAGSRAALLAGTSAAAVSTLVLAAPATVPHEHQQAREIAVAPAPASARLSSARLPAAPSTSAARSGLPQALRPNPSSPAVAAVPRLIQSGAVDVVTTPGGASTSSSPAEVGAPATSTLASSSPAASPVPTGSPQPGGSSAATDVESAAPSTVAGGGRSQAEVSRSVPISLSAGQSGLPPGVLQITVPAGWALTSVTAANDAFPCAVDSKTTASCQVTGPVQSEYAVRVDLLGPLVAGQGDTIEARYVSDGQTLLTEDYPLS